MVAVLAAQPAHAAPEAADGSSEAAILTATVVALDGEQLVLDVGRTRAREGAVLTLYRLIEVKHPITGATLRDRFPNGAVRIVQVGDALSLARPVSAPPRAPAVGDRVEAETARVAPRSDAQCDQCAQVAEEQRLVLQAFHASLGKTPEQRIAIFREHLEQYPQSPFRTWLEFEIQYFSSSRFVAASARQARSAYDAALGGLVKIRPLIHARAGMPLELGVYVPPETQIRSVSLYLLRGDQTIYSQRTIRLDEQGQGYVRVPERFVAPPGFLYFVESTLPDNRKLSVLGTADKPLRCRVSPQPGKPVRTNVSRVRAVAEYVSFDGLSGRDHYYLAEGDFLLRLQTPVLSGVRVGYGHYRGEGGSVEELDVQRVRPRPAAFTYGYLELVFALHEMFALMPRVEVGLGRPREDAELGSRVRPGGQLRVRIGRERGTHFVLAGESAPEIGQRAFVGLTLGLVERWPLAFEVHVTDQPVNTDELGVRAVFEVGYRPSEVFSLSARASYQGRTIDHAGPGLGLATTFDW